MYLEITVATVLVTIARIVWIQKKPVHRDITFYILPGLSNLRKLTKYDRGFSYVPYGLLWYTINVPIVRLGKYSGHFWIETLALIDGFFLWYSFQAMGLVIFLAYMLIGTFQLFRAPWNVSINWLITLAPLSWVFLLLAPIAKLPVGLPVQVWGYTERAVGHQRNYIYFGLLGTLWIIIFNHLFFLPEIETLLVVSLGIVWSLILGNAYFSSRTRRTKATASERPGPPKLA